ncbi:universal stress protein, partial [Streptomyces olivaceus]|uniref:universal stress protein n=1 Tax=Streptomyces olivaceus TaxID=47716 RepID=UPI0036A35584
SLTPVGPPAPATGGGQPVVVAVGAHDRAAAVVDSAARLARDTGSPLEVVHVRQTAVVEEQAVVTESDEQARRAVTAHLDRLREAGVAATGQILDGVGDHAAAGRALARHATEVRARTVAVGGGGGRPPAPGAPPPLPPPRPPHSPPPRSPARAA